jgi:hypothetical protein
MLLRLGCSRLASNGVCARLKTGIRRILHFGTESKTDQSYSLGTLPCNPKLGSLTDVVCDLEYSLSCITMQVRILWLERQVIFVESFLDFG